jgi:hypothetical protein
MAKSTRLITDHAKWHGKGDQFIYVYTFKSCRERKNKKNGMIKMKIGMTTQASPIMRINQQLGTSNHEKAVLLHVYKTYDSLTFEKIMHKKLKSMGRHIGKKESIGREWFWIKENEITKILKNANNSVPKQQNRRNAFGINVDIGARAQGLIFMTIFLGFCAPSFIIPFWFLFGAYVVCDTVGII